jgi:putative nucleotidyltransferase with HDIG domain
VQYSAPVAFPVVPSRASLPLPSADSGAGGRIHSHFRDSGSFAWGAATALLYLLDPETRQHSLRVARLASELAQTLSDDPQWSELVYLGGPTHDVGKLFIPRSTFLKPGSLSAMDVAALRQHPRLGAELLTRYKFRPEIVSMARYHHERFDGSGYPNGLAGRSIAFTACLLAVVDAFDAMAYSRCYRSGASWKRALAQIKKSAGKDFDPLIVQALDSSLQRKPV